MKALLAGAIRRLRPAPLASAIAHVSGMDKREPVVTEHGTFLVNPLSDLGYRLRRGEYEPETKGVLSRYLRAGGVFIDLGANEGYFSVLGSRLVGPHGRVIAVEPQSRLQDVIRANLVENKCSNVRVVKAVVASRTEKVALKLAPDMNTGATSLFRSTKYPLPTEDVQSFTLDEFLDTASTSYCDLMKVDVEGAEYDVFAGAQSVLKRGVIRHMCIEIHGAILERRGLSWDPVHQSIVECGYKWENNSDPRVYTFAG